MRSIAPPQYDVLVVYQTCANSVDNIALRNRLNAVALDIVSAAKDYGDRAPAKQLFSILPNSCRNDAIVIGAVTKKELKDVYKIHMVGRAKPARLIYDNLLALAPLGRCPFCGFGHASTLDHYLPKAKYPLLIVLPLNLVPACKDCNTGKKTKIARSEDRQVLHPYFDHNRFVTDQWLFAEVKQTRPASIQYCIRPPDYWSNVDKERVKNHFKDLQLEKRFSVEASNQLACLRSTLISYLQISGPAHIRQHLAIEFRSHHGVHKNSWQTAMFQALAASDWYCEGGFNFS